MVMEHLGTCLPSVEGKPHQIRGTINNTETMEMYLQRIKGLLMTGLCLRQILL